MNRKSIVACLGMLVSLLATPVMAKELTASIANLPVLADTPDKGVLIDLVKAIEKESGIPIKREVAPFVRSMDAVINHRADFHLPLIMVPNADESKLEYDHATETIFHVNFVLYSNKNKPLDMSKLGSYKLETDRAHIQYFPFPTEASSSLENSLKRVDAGRIDGFIFAALESDSIIKQDNLKNIHRSLYKTFDVKIILPKGGRGGETDKLLTSAIESLRKKGLYDKIMASVEQPYVDWQP